jgi:hypothetical protein
MKFKVIKKAAMFGLDARIALAIFGALSVISGAALYSAIKQAKTVKQVATLNEVAKAVEQHYLDTARIIHVAQGLGAVNGIGLLYSNYMSDSNWKGPYIGYGSSSIWDIELKLFDNNAINTVSTARQLPSVWTGTDSTSAPSCAFKSLNCFVYLRVSANSEDNLEGYNELVDFYKRLDSYIDNADGSRSGKFRYVDSGSVVTIYYQLQPAKYI